MRPLQTLLLALTVVLSANAQGAITIIQQPQSQVVRVGHNAKFAVNAEADGLTLTYQWQRNEVNIPGATDYFYFTGMLSRSDSGSNFRVIISAPGLDPVTSATASILVCCDPVPPQIIHAGRRGEYSAEILVVFWDKVPPLFGCSANLYTLDGGATVTRVDPGRTETEYILITENLSPNAPHQLTVRNMRDYFGNASFAQTIPVTLAFPDPSPTFTYANNALTISWRVQNYLSDPFYLEASTDLSKSNLWGGSSGSGSFSIEGDWRHLTLNPASNARFFRLTRKD